MAREPMRGVGMKLREAPLLALFRHEVAQPNAQWLRRANPCRSRSRADSPSGAPTRAAARASRDLFVEEPAQPGPPIELPPRSLRLGETIGDRVDCGGIYAEPDMTCLDLDVFRRCGLALNTALPSDDAV